MNDEPEEIGIPEWVVTFGDMMSLLLTFFIMLVSLSEIKEEETYQALVDSMQRQFGYAKTLDSLTPGESKPRSSAFRTLATTGRAKKKDTASGGVEAKAPTGEDPTVRIVRPGSMTAVGSVVFFEVASNRLTPQAHAVLKDLAAELRGKPQKVEIRGHVSSQYATRAGSNAAAVMLGIERAEAVRAVLVDQEGMNPRRFRVSSAADAEPISRDSRSGKSAQNPRVEVFMLDETVEDLSGTADERQQATIQDAVQETP